jgi:hypothetical protein
MKLRERSPLGALPRPGLIPYITLWTSESARRPCVVQHGHEGIAYADERRDDRDPRGVLWDRIPSSPGVGRPEFGKVHALRQRQSMRELLCQMCGEPVARQRTGVLWLLSREEYDPRRAPSQIETVNPPVCLPCARSSVSACPHLRKGYVALRARSFEVVGVFGARYRPGPHGPQLEGALRAEYGRPEIQWTRASKLVMRLRRYALVDLADESAADD